MLEPGTELKQLRLCSRGTAVGRQRGSAAVAIVRHVAADFALGERHRTAVVQDATAGYGSGVIADCAVLERQCSAVANAPTVGAAVATNDAVFNRRRAGVLDAATVDQETSGRRSVVTDRALLYRQGAKEVVEATTGARAVVADRALLNRRRAFAAEDAPALTGRRVAADLAVVEGQL